MRIASIVADTNVILSAVAGKAEGRGRFRACVGPCGGGGALAGRDWKIAGGGCATFGGGQRCYGRDPAGVLSVAALLQALGAAEKNLW